MERFGAILHEPWRKGAAANEIQGSWAEDMNPYQVTCPAEFRDMLVEMQNALCAKYSCICGLERELAAARHEAASFFKQPKARG